MLLAENDFATAIAEAKTAVLARLAELRKRAAAAGDLDQLKIIESQHRAFESDGVVPDVAGIERTTRAFVQTRNRARKRLLESYDLAIATYTREGNITSAEELAARRNRRLEEFEAPSTLGADSDLPATINPRGEPIDFLAGRTQARAAVWIDDLGIWHVRFAPGSTGMRFEGTIKLRGGAWAGPVIPVLTGRSRKPDRGAFLNQSTFEYEIYTPKNGLDGLDFQVAGANAELIFEMKSNGALMAADSIVIGKGGAHPPGGHFALKNLTASPQRRGGRTR
jgi:hypothetical protein